MPVPASHVDEGLKLTQDGEVVFYRIDLKNVPVNGTAVVRFRDGPQGLTTQWNNQTWDHMPCQLTGQSRSAEEEKNRPTLRLINPVGIFNQPARDGQFDGSIVQQFTVLKGHVDAGLPISDNKLWYIGRVKDLISGQSISFELRALSDGPEHYVPARMFIPPDFNFVTL